MATKKLSASDLNLFRLASRAAAANPFSAEREELDRRIAGKSGKAEGPAPSLEGVQKVASRLAVLDGGNPITLHDYRAGDRDVLSLTFLFDTFHRHADSFDRLIEKQAAAGANTVEVPFAEAITAELSRRGFTDEECRRHLGLFYQIRRAFHFIEQGLIGRSPAMRGLRTDLWNNIFTHDIRTYDKYIWDRMEDFSTLLLGPTGSGKGAAAAAIGRSGFIPFDPDQGRYAASFTANFVPINLQEYPQSLLESELFGHAKGAFTGAVHAHKGIFDLCPPQGSIFLDEIGEIGAPTQIKLLTVLQERSFSPVGSHKKLRFHGRIIAATNRPLRELRGPDGFRDDFYYRLCSDCIEVPGLAQKVREAPGELDDLVEHTVERIVGHPSPELTGRALEVIARRLGPDYPWPGNVRELAQCVRRIILKGDYEGDRLEGERGLALAGRLAGGELSAQELLAAYCHHLYSLHGTYETAARIAGLDRRTVKRHVLTHQARKGDDQDA